MMMFFSEKPHKEQTRREEIANTISHALGLVAAIVAAPFLIFYSATHGDAWAVIGTTVFIVSAMTLYFSSSVYHGIREGIWKDRFQIVDHVAIFILIAGTYTPFTLGVLQGTFGWIMFGLIWLFAIAGIVLKIITGIKNMKIWVAYYLMMGWLIIIAIKPLIEAMHLFGLIWIAAGGAAYTLGVIFYILPRRKYSHFVWHLFVLAGTAFHFVAVMFHSF
jgi:hemolysin III